MAASNLQKIILEACGPITVTYYRRHGKTIAHALQFNIMGMGDNKDEALEDLRELFWGYFLEHLKSGDFSTFLSPADGAYWNKSSRENFFVQLKVHMTAPVQRFIRQHSLKAAAQNRIDRYIEDLELAPATH